MSTSSPEVLQRNKKVLVPATDSETLNVKRELDAQPKFKVRLFQTPAGKGEKLPNKPVSINGYSYQITRGVPVEVPQSVYEVLIHCGEVDPLEPEFQHLIPDTSETDEYIKG